MNNKCYRYAPTKLSIPTLLNVLLFFVRARNQTIGFDSTELPDDHILGYAIIVSFTLKSGFAFTHILEAVVKPPFIISKDSEPSAVTSQPIAIIMFTILEYINTVIGTKNHYRTIIFPGTFFAQQNTITHVCAHACLRMSLNSSPFLMGSKLTNKDINDFLKIKNYDASSGLGQDQIREIV